MSIGPSNFRYLRWDGTQHLPGADGNEIFDEIRDSLLYHGDVSAALKKLMSDGFKPRNGNRISGLREAVGKLARRRKEILSQRDPSGILQEISDAIDKIRETETEFINGKLSADSDLDNARSEELNSKLIELSFMGSDPTSQIQSLKKYEFASSQAAADFEKLLEEISSKLLNNFFHEMKQGMQGHSQEDIAQMREMMGDLNSLLSNYRQGTDTAEQFNNFMEKWGTSFPPGIGSVEDLIEFLTTQMKASAAMFNSLSPTQRRELMELSQEMLGDLDLGWQIDQLSENLAPFMGGVPRYGFHGDQPFGLAEAPEVFSELGELSELENYLRQVSTPADLADIDLAEVERNLGKDARDSLEALSKIANSLEESGLISNDENELKMTPKGMRQIGDSVLSELFSRDAGLQFGDHTLTKSGIGNDLEYETKQYEFGDPFNLNINKTIRNALLRDGKQIPIRITPGDFEVERNERLAKASTVLLLDLSLSMPLRDNFLAAKKVAVALSSLISTKFPKDYLAIVGFSEVARRIEPRQLPEISWDYVYGTNMEHALLMARELLRFEEGSKQILMITDGEPTAHILPSGEVFFSYPSTPETITATFKEVMRCTREEIKINSFVLDATPDLRRFMEKFASINKGKVFYSDPEDLGNFVIFDYLNNRANAL